ncbi:unnamed protein product [Penicillium camemberti]|uniref:Str. FM013 n=1 Tax=Penicillium camemberti (strain FM 013) TaxID=1429867 RepID=A0A0G4NXU8_PENC3|nr:unnamed protein product [Penicillium camemberti]
METDKNSRSGFRVLCAARDIEEPGLWELGRKGQMFSWTNIPIMTRRLAASRPVRA